MSIPKFTKEEFNKLTNKKLNNDDFRQYKGLFTDNYKKDKETSKYILKDDLSAEVLTKIDYILKRIEHNVQFESITDIAKYFRLLLDDKKYIVLFAYNGTGKTRLSIEFKSLGQESIEDTEEKTADTLYYNAFTEDLFHWDNDIENDSERSLKFNSNSRFFAGLKDLAIDERVRTLLGRYADFYFDIRYEESKIIFSRDVLISGHNTRIDNIKISRGEENIFIWCFFLAVVQLVAEQAESYNWVKYIYVDDPISSLDDNNAIAVACHLTQLIKSNHNFKVIISSHHALFFNVLCNEIGRAEQLFLQKNGNNYLLKDTTKTPFFHHVALLKELKKASDSGQLYTYHFNTLRNILEKTASFHGFAHFSSCIKRETDENEPVYKRMLDLLSHGSYSLFEPVEMVEDNKEYFRSILDNFLDEYNFNRKLFADSEAQEEQE